jgi:CBS domain-containing protein
MQVQQVMTPAPSVRQTASLADVVTVLMRQPAGDAYVTDDGGRLLGVVPDYALLKARLLNVDDGLDVCQMMTAHVETIAPDQSMTEVAPLFRECRHQQMPVVDHGRLVGCLRRGDVLRWLCTRELAAEDSPAPSPVVPRAPHFHGARCGVDC